MKTFLLVLLAIAALAPAARGDAQGTKWHPGHYVMLAGGADPVTHQWQIVELQKYPNIRGVMVRFSWHDLEPKKDQYDFSLIDTYLAALRQSKTTKRLVVRIMERQFGAEDPSVIVPDYLRTDPIYNGGIVLAGNRYVSRLWEAPVMSRVISIYQALGRRYDSEPLFEGAFTEESTLGYTTDGPPGYSHELLGEQYIRFAKAVKPTMPTSNLFLNANWIGSPAVMRDLIQALRDAKVAAGGSNVIPGRPTLGQQVLMGDYGADYRRELPIGNGIERGELGGVIGDFTPRQIGAYAYDPLQAHYLFWIRKTEDGTPEQQWYTGILPYIASGPRLRTRCPNVYAICDTSDPPPIAPTNERPTVSAGADTTAQMPNAAVTLAGSVTDDGLPGALASVGWTQITGPDRATFTDAQAPTSPVRFPSAGIYLLRLTANDGELSASDELTVTVAAAEPPPPVPPPTPPPPAPPPPAPAPAPTPPPAPAPAPAPPPVPAPTPQPPAPAPAPPPTDGGAAPPTGGAAAEAPAQLTPAPVTPSDSSAGGGGSIGLLELLLFSAMLLARAFRGQSAVAARGGNSRQTDSGL